MGGAREREVDLASINLLSIKNESILGESCCGVLGELFAFSFQPELGLVPTPSPPSSG